jgi:hypothetical protein
MRAKFTSSPTLPTYDATRRHQQTAVRRPSPSPVGLRPPFDPLGYYRMLLPAAGLTSPPPTHQRDSSPPADGRTPPFPLSSRAPPSLRTREDGLGGGRGRGRGFGWVAVWRNPSAAAANRHQRCGRVTGASPDFVLDRWDGTRSRKVSWTTTRQERNHVPATSETSCVTAFVCPLRGEASATTPGNPHNSIYRRSPSRRRSRPRRRTDPKRSRRS